MYQYKARVNQKCTLYWEKFYFIKLLKQENKEWTGLNQI